MFPRLRHNLTLALPLLGLAVVIVFAGALGSVVVEVAHAPISPSSSTLAVIGDGLDEFMVRTHDALARFLLWATGNIDWLSSLAVFSTITTLIVALQNVRELIGGPRDSVAVVKHVAQRSARAVGIGATPVAWGVVRDDQTGHPLAFARIHLIDGVGRIVATSIADSAGVYGYALSPHVTARHYHIAAVLAEKDGYHTPMGSIPTGSTLADAPLPISMTSLRAGGASNAGGVRRFVGGVAFWTALATIPVVATVAPASVSASMIGAFAVSLIIRANSR